MKIINGLFISVALTAKLLCPSSLMGEQAAQIPPFALITIPKAGSHVVIKALHFMTGGISIWHTRFPSLQYIPGNNGFLYTHFCVSPELEDDYSQLPQLKKIIMIRDLRDVCVSMVNQICKAPWPGLTSQQRNAFLKMSFVEQLLFVINYEYDVHKVAESSPNSLQVSILKVAQQAEEYTRNPNHLICRYEDLVGSQGGGSDEAQIRELNKMAAFLEISIPDEEIKEIASSLYGDEVDPFGKSGFKNFRSTFHQGKIGRWKETFNEEHKAAFKQKLGSLLISLGYEQDNNW